ncbi:MAG: hypothetical protein ABIR08_05795 [Sphingomonas sp.]
MTDPLRPAVRHGVDLAAHVERQLEAIVPAPASVACQGVAPHVDAALARLSSILRSVRIFDPDVFDPYHALQYASFLYLLGNEAWRQAPGSPIVDRLFILNRALNSLDLYPATPMPEIFFLSHALGAVLGNATYGERLVIFQNVTVGRIGENRPQIGENVVLYPGASVTGRSRIGRGAVIASGTRIHNIDVPDNCIASLSNGKIEISERPRDFADLYFRT